MTLEEPRMNTTNARRVFARTLVGLTLVAAILAALAVSPMWSEAAPGPADVRVINGAAQAVPTAAQGTTQVGGTVGIDPANNTVRIAGGSTPPIPVQEHKILTVPDGDQGASINLLRVPDGKRFVGQYLSVRGPVEAGRRLTGQLVLSFGGGVDDIVTPFDRSPNVPEQGTEFAEASTPIVAYGAPGTEVSYSVLRRDPAGTVSFSVTLIGELVDVPGAG